MELPAPLAVSASSMRAAVTTRYGRPEVVKVREVPTPTPADNEVLVRVRASSVCFGDRIFRSGPLLIRLLSGFRPRLRTVIGRRYRLDEIAEAHRYADTGHKIGNVAVLIGDQTERLNEAAGAPPPTR